MTRYGLATAVLAVAALAAPPSWAFVPSTSPFAVRSSGAGLFSTTEEVATEPKANNVNVAQTEDTSREKVMTFSYDMSLEPEYEKPTYPGTGNGLSGGEDG
eukprot:CAMPEP_0197455312 /NCGR_PEP_ID=MMETSP1175-20131217/40458_1 /TAXON_ID=1003142 /ORGANISM="Triceratium dubium, Strain CCMP147" /LENGTH=100 /DNA_ID=CAMNT_0042989133 /DNA_START=100 /DNA_END=398 /DNA_ORIENTATION=-